MKTYPVGSLLENKRFKLSNPGADIGKSIGSVYIGDLLSWVMAHAGQKCAWITVQTHRNTVAVAVLREMSCIVLPEGCKPDEDTLEKAKEEGIPILESSWNSYEIACFLKEELES